METASRAGSSRVDALVREDRVHRSLYLDPEIFALEMRRIFERTWCYVAHESEIAAPGDYKTAHIGLQPVIVSRLDDGRLVGLLNRCTHRGSVICREERGNASFFRCPYHAWTFKSTGELIGVPGRGRYPPDFDLRSLDATRVPRLESYRGFVFASLNPQVEPIAAYLAQARRWLDALIDLSVEGRVSLAAGPHRHTYAGNWKLQMENGVDGYHAVFLHETYFSLQKMHAHDGDRFGPRDESLGWTSAFDNGHALLARHLPDEQMAAVRAGFPDYYARVEALRGSERMRDLLTQMNLFIFPNLYVLLNQVRVIRPLGPNATDVTMYPFFLEGAPPELNAQRLREHQVAYAPTGFIGPDDYAAFDCVTEGLAASGVPWLMLARGLHDERIAADGSRIGAPSDETPQRGIYRRYRALMRAEDAA